MSYHIDTIPIWDAVRSGSECPLCTLARSVESGMIELYLGGSVMEPATRIAVNDRGFCARHLRMLWDSEQKLPLALMLDTRMDTLLEKLRPLLQAASDEAARKKPARKLTAASKLLSAVEKECAGCVVCERSGAIMERYTETVASMLSGDADFRKSFAGCRGFCQPHFAALLRELLKPALLRDPRPLIAMLCDLQREALSRLHEETHFFTTKFNYRNADKPWGTAKDAPQRALQKLRGYEAGAPEDAQNDPDSLR